MSDLLSGSSSLLGFAVAAYIAYQTVSYALLHLLHRSRLPRYQHSQSSSGRAWALVTGASDGIGKGFAEELCQRGFNVVIHGRNQKKLEGVADELKRRWPEASIRLAVLNAYPITEKGLDHMIAGFNDLPITVLINNSKYFAENEWVYRTWPELPDYQLSLAMSIPNARMIERALPDGPAVGGYGPILPVFRQLNALSYEDISTLIGINLDFPVMLTAKLLPALRTRQPALIINVGSFTGGLQSPYISVYAGTKAFIESWSRSMSAEMKAEGDDVEILSLIVGEVQASWDRSPTSFTRCSSRRLATDALNKVGCGRRICTPYIGHELPGFAVKMMPEWMADMILIGIAKKMKANEEKTAQKQA